jgi:hypothetical protein
LVVLFRFLLGFFRTLGSALLILYRIVVFALLATRLGGSVLFVRRILRGVVGRCIRLAL